MGAIPSKQIHNAYKCYIMQIHNALRKHRLSKFNVYALLPPVCSLISDITLTEKGPETSLHIKTFFLNRLFSCFISVFALQICVILCSFLHFHKICIHFHNNTSQKMWFLLKGAFNLPLLLQLMLLKWIYMSKHM